MKNSNKNCYLDNVRKPKSDSYDSHILDEDSDLFYFDIAGNREIIEKESLDNCQSVIKLSNHIASKGAVAVEDNSNLRNKIKVYLKNHDCKKRMYDGKSTGTIISSKNHKNVFFVDVSKSDCEVTQTNNIYKSEIKRNKLGITDTSKNNSLDSFIPNENLLKMDSCSGKPEPINVVDLVQLKQAPIDIKHIENIPISSRLIEEVNCNKFTAVSKDEQDTCQDKRNTNKFKNKVSSSTLQKEEGSYLNREYAHRKCNIENKEKDKISLQNTEIFYDINSNKKNKEVQSKNIKEMLNEQNQIETSCELDDYPTISTIIKRKKKKIKEIHCKDGRTKDNLQRVSCSEENMLNITAKSKKKKKKTELEIMNNYGEKQRELCDNRPMCHTSEMEELDKQKCGIEDICAFNNSCSNFKSKKKRKIKDFYTEVNSNGIQEEILSASVGRGSDVGTVKKKKAQSDCEKLDRSVDIYNIENFSNFVWFHKKKKKKAKAMYYEDENKLHTEINSVTNEDILYLAVKNKKRKKESHSEKFETEETSKSHYETSRKYRKKKIDNGGKVINENCDGKSWDNNKNKKMKKIISLENLDRSINEYRIDNYQEEQREQFHNGFKCSNSEVNELNKQKKRKNKRIIRDSEFGDNIQLEYNCNHGLQEEMFSNSNRKILKNGSMKNKESHSKKLEGEVNLCGAEICDKGTRLNEINKKNTEAIVCQDSQQEKNDSNQIKSKKRNLKNIYNDYDITELHKDMSETKRKKIHSVHLDASVSLYNIEHSVGMPKDILKKKMKNRKERYSVELTESKERSADDTDEHLKKKKKQKQHISKYEMTDICDDTSASKKLRRPLSKFAKQFKMKNKKCEVITVEADRPCLEDDVSDFCIEELNINIPFTVHPLHMICTRPSRPKPEEIAAAQEANIKIKSGFFTQAEDNKIRENWQAFCKEHGLNVNPSYFFKFPPRMKTEQKLKFLQYLGHGLEDRLPYRVHYRFKKIFQKPLMKQGRFSKNEDEQILTFLATTESKSPFKHLAQILNRTNLSIEKRYDYLCSSQKPKIKWTIDVVDQLVNYMLKITKSENIDSLRNVKFTSKQWLKLSKKMGYISVKRIQRAWKVYIYPRLFSNEYVDLVKIKKKIIKILYKRNETDWRSVNWEEIAAKFDGFTAQKIYMMFKQTVYFHAPEEISNNLKDCVHYMKNIFLKESELHSTHKFDKFIYKDGHVQYKSVDKNNLE